MRPGRTCQGCRRASLPISSQGVTFHSRATHVAAPDDGYGMRTRHQAGGTGIQAAASESAAVAAGCAIGDHFGARRSQSSVCWRSAGGWSSSDRLCQPNNGRMVQASQPPKNFGAIHSCQRNSAARRQRGSYSRQRRDRTPTAASDGAPGPCEHRWRCRELVVEAPSS